MSLSLPSQSKPGPPGEVLADHRGVEDVDSHPAAGAHLSAKGLSSTAALVQQSGLTALTGLVPPHPARPGRRAAAWAALTSPPALHTRDCTFLTAHCILHTTNCVPYTAHCTFPTAHCILRTTKCILHTSHYTLHTSHCTLYTSHFTLHTSHFTLNT